MGYGASHGIFLVINNTVAKNLSKSIKVFEKIPNVWATLIDCCDFSTNR